MFSSCKIDQIKHCNNFGCEWVKKFGGCCSTNNRGTAPESYWDLFLSEEDKIKKEKPKVEHVIKKKECFVPSVEVLVKKSIPVQTKNKKTRIYEASNGICYLCGEKLDKNSFNLDHIVPISRGGKNNEANLRATHIKCNSEKGDKFITELIGDSKFKILKQEDWIKKIKVKL